MVTDSSHARSRRAVLMAGASGLAAMVAGVLGRASPVRAEGEAMHVGGDYLEATSATQLKNTTTDNDVLIATSTKGGRGVYGKSTGHSGVEGQTLADWPHAGVRGFTLQERGTGVRGDNESAGTIGILGAPSPG